MNECNLPLKLLFPLVTFFQWQDRLGLYSCRTKTFLEFDDSLLESEVRDNDVLEVRFYPITLKVGECVTSLWNSLCI